MNRLLGKVALITGGNSGIGFATAKAFLAEGAARVIITGRNGEALNRAAAELGENATALISDAGLLTDIDRLAQQVNEITEGIDIVFINAGVAEFAPNEYVDETAFDRTFAINVKGPYFTIKTLLPLLRDGSSIILNGSINAYMGMANSSLYSASKAALHSFAKTLSAELLSRHIRINVVSPGPVNTPIYGKLGMAPEELQAVAAGIQSQIPIGRFGAAEEIANIVTFLASDESTFMLGAEVVADGGMTTL